MFAAVEFRDRSHWSNGSKSIAQYGFRFASDSKDECLKYVKEHYREFLDQDGNSSPAIVEFSWDEIPRTHQYWRESPESHICYWKDADYLVNKVVERNIPE